jgi:hypothetical protein
VPVALLPVFDTWTSTSLKTEKLLFAVRPTLFPVIESAASDECAALEPARQRKSPAARAGANAGLTTLRPPILPMATF